MGDKQFDDEYYFRILTEFGREHSFEEEHSVHVAKLALSLFDQLYSIHKLDEHAKKILFAGAMLHDVGATVSYDKHHKHSYKIIVNAKIEGFSTHELVLAANVARYHRKSEPKDKHENFAALSDGDKALVSKLASILRIADGLDRAHAKSVSKIDVQIVSPDISLDLSSSGELLLEDNVIEKKSKMFCGIFHHNLIFRKSTNE